MKMKTLARATLATVMSAGLLMAGQAQARQLTYAMGFPPNSDSDVAGQNFAETVSELTDGELTVKVFALSLLNFAETPGGVRDGMADMGYVLTPYFPNQFPHMNLVAEASMLINLMDESLRGREGYAYVGAMAEFVLLNCPDCLADMEKENQVMTSNAGSSPYGLTCTKPVTNREQLEGARLRVAGSHWSRWAQAFGATPVTLSSNEAAEALSQGVVDCVVISAPELTNLGLFEHVTDITMSFPGGIFAGTATTNMNRDTWQSLSESEREAILKAGSRLAAEIPYVYHDRQQKVLERIRDEQGAKLHEADPELLAEIQDFVRADLERMAEFYRTERGVENSAEMLARFEEILEKWSGLVTDVGSHDELAQLYWDEVYSKIDVTTHGM
ncbi:C4-dicarboxylate TRAP transporter substrate-binding protein [Marinobacter bryozoorum]|uniref:C4-dicarboxylate TRAP transporter substrate-binding protein n=1 Tax=Marinobacter bryozoorum TaxID=256324 RepID=UPI002003FBF8|nr:C4-dicarboxylate TRAP transporter substrate-binding protein [Marinobacter bryozoorum]MCK7542746.1 C4-dicarboxylate TRAP transporter substrate-binding protein [Marinobacter bryozoorum]